MKSKLDFDSDAEYHENSVCSDTMMNDSAENNSIYDNIYHEEVN
jgi:hypothetical protein